MIDSEVQNTERPAPDAGRRGPPLATRGVPSTARRTTEPGPTNGGSENAFEHRYASEARAEQLTLITIGPSIRRGDSDHIEVGLGLPESGPQSYVQGTDRLDVGGTYTEHTGGDGITQSTRMSTTVRGHLNLKGKGDTGILGGTLVDTHIGPEVLAAGMSDDLIVGVGVRTTVAGDLWLCGLMGMEEKVGIAAVDGALVELYGMSFEREYGAGLHNAGAVNFSGPTFVTQAAGFRPLLKAMTGPRNLVPGAGAPAGGASASPPPAAPGAGSAGMLADPSLATGADEIAGVEDAQDGGRILRVVADAPGDVPPARTSDTAESLGDAQRLADANEAADSGGATEDAAEAAADFWRRVEADAEPNAADQNLIVVEGAGGDRTVTVTDGSASDDQNWRDLFDEQSWQDLFADQNWQAQFDDQQIDYPNAQHIDQAGDGVNPPAAAGSPPAPAGGDGAGPDIPERRYRQSQPRIFEDPKTFDYEEVMDYTGRGRWDRLLSKGPGDSADGHAHAIMLDTQIEASAYVDNVVARLVDSDPVFYNAYNLQDANLRRGDQYRSLSALSDSLPKDQENIGRVVDIQQAMADIREGVHSRLYAGLETAETVYVHRVPLADDVDQNQLVTILANRRAALVDEISALTPQGELLSEGNIAQFQKLNNQLVAVDGTLDTVRTGYDPIHYLDGMISFRGQGGGPDGAEAYKALQVDVENLIDSMTPIRLALADPDTTGVALTRFDFAAASDPEALEVITANQYTLGDASTRARTQAQYILTETGVGTFTSEVSPYTLSPTQVEEMLNAELASLPDTPENAQRIQELNNALVTLDQRMKNIMGDALLWVDQTGVDAPQALSPDARQKSAQAAWTFSQKSDTHLQAALETGDTYELHLANLYDLAAQDLRKGTDPTETLEGLSQGINLDPEIQRAAQTVLGDVRGTYAGPIPNMALTPAVLENAIYPRTAEDPALKIAEHLPEYWDPKRLSGNIEPAQSGTKKWWKSLKGVKKRVGNVLTTLQGIHAPDRFRGAWQRSMLTAGSSGADGAPRRLANFPQEVPNLTTYKKDKAKNAGNAPTSTGFVSGPENPQDVIRQNLNITPSQLVSDTPPAGAGPKPDSLEDTLPSAPLDGAEGPVAPVSDIDELDDDPIANGILLPTSKHQAWTEAMEALVPNIGQGVPDEQARVEKNLWEKIGFGVIDGYDPMTTYTRMRLSAEAEGALPDDAHNAYLRVFDAIRHLEADPELQHIDYTTSMNEWNNLAFEDQTAPNNEAFFHMQEGTRVSNRAAQDVLRRLDSTIPPEELQQMEFNDAIARITKIYKTAAENEDTRKTREISRLLDSLDDLMQEHLTYRHEEAAIARAQANEPLVRQYDHKLLLGRIDNRNYQVQQLPVEPEIDQRKAQLTTKQQQTWNVIKQRLKKKNVDPQRTAEDFLAAAKLNELPKDEINLYQNILEEVVAFKRDPRSRSMQAFPDRNNRRYVLNDLYDTRDTLAAEQAQLDVLDPEQAERYKALEFEIKTYDLLAERTQQGHNPLVVVENLRYDTEELGEVPAELETLRRIEGNLQELLEGPDAKLAETTDWVRAAEVQMAEDLADGNQSSAAKMRESLDQIDEHARRVLEQALRDTQSDPSQPLNGYTQAETVDKANYYHARGHLLKEIEDNTKLGKHEEAARLRTALDELDEWPEALLRDTFVNAEAQRDANQRKLGANLDPDDYVNQMIPYLDNARETARKNQLAGEPYELDVLEADLWDTIVRRTESDEYDPMATAEDLFATVMITIHDRTGATPDEIEAELLVYQKVLDIITYTIRPDVPGRGQVGEAWEYARVPTVFRPADPNAVVPGMDDPVPTVRIILNNAMSSDAFLAEAARRQESGGVKSVEEWFGSQSARLEQMREGDGDLMAQPGGGAQDLPPGWNPPAHINNAQPTLDSSGAHWASDGPAAEGSGGPAGWDYTEGFPDVPVREKPRPNSGNRPPRQYEDLDDVLDAPPPPVSDRPRPDNRTRPSRQYADLEDALDAPPPVSDRPRASNRTRPSRQYADLEDALDAPPPVSDRPRASNRTRPSKEYADLEDALDAPPPVSDRPRPRNSKRPSEQYTDLEDVYLADVFDGPPLPARDPSGPGADKSYLPVGHEKEKRSKILSQTHPLQPEDPTRPTSPGLIEVTTDFEAKPPDTPGGKWYVEIDLNDHREAFNDFGPVWGIDPDIRLDVTYQNSTQVIDPSLYEIRLGYFDKTKGVFDPEFGGKVYPFEVKTVLDSNLERPGAGPDVEELLEVAQARLRSRPPSPDNIAAPGPGPSQANLDAVLDAIPLEQLDAVGGTAGPNAGGVFYPPPAPNPNREFPAPLPEGVTWSDRYRELARAHTPVPDAPIGSVQGVDYVFAPPTASVVPELPTLEFGEDATQRVPAIVRPTVWKSGESLPVIKLHKADQMDIIAGAPLRVSTPDGLTALAPGKYIVIIQNRGKTHRVVFQDPDTYDADLRIWVRSIQNL